MLAIIMMVQMLTQDLLEILVQKSSMLSKVTHQKQQVTQLTLMMRLLPKQIYMAIGSRVI